MSNLEPNCCLEFDFRKVDQHAGGKWLIHDTKLMIENKCVFYKGKLTTIMCKIPVLCFSFYSNGHGMCPSVSAYGII